MATSAVLAFAILLSGCNALQKKSAAPQVPARPVWIENPGNGVSASAGWNPRGRAAQEEMAIARARNEYAKRFGVEVAGVLEQSTTVFGSSSSSSGSTELKETVNQKDVRAEVKAKWLDPSSDTIWVWLVPSK
jgi:hypothetical protein